jgi:hypothetical protein
MTDALSYLQPIYNDPLQLRNVQMKTAIEALPFERPNLAVTAVLNVEILRHSLTAR